MPNVGPDQMIPLYGLLGTLVGIALVFWRRLAQGFRMFSAKRPALRKHA